MSDIKQIDEYVDATAHCLSELIKDCSVKWEQTPTAYIFTVKVSLNSKYVMECDVLEPVHYVQACCMRFGNLPEDLAEELLIKFFGSSTINRYTECSHI